MEEDLVFAIEVREAMSASIFAAFVGRHLGRAQVSFLCVVLAVCGIFDVDGGGGVLLVVAEVLVRNMVVVEGGTLCIENIIMTSA